MLFVLFTILFKIIPNNKIIKNPSIRKQVKSQDQCWDNLENYEFTSQSFDEYAVYCHSGLSPSVFKMTTTSTSGQYSSSSNSKVFKIQNVECTITDSNFSNCVFHDSLINFEGTNNNYIVNSNTFTNNYDGSGPSSANIMYVNAKTTTIQDNTITFESVDKACRTFSISNNEKTVLTGNDVTNGNINTNSNQKGNGAYISGTNTANPVKISDCTFTTCGKDSPLYVVILNVPKFEFTFNKITFSSSSASCGCVSSSSSTEIIYMNNIFENAYYSSNKWRSAGIDQEAWSTSQEIVTIENNTFNNILGNNQGRCILININNPISTSFRENTFQNCPSGSILVKIIFQNSINEFVLDSCKFIRNTLNQENSDTFSSCNQIIIQNVLRSDCSMPYLLTLENCLFEGNSSPLKGGGFHYGNNRYGTNTIIHLNSCQFVNNQANEKGGAVAIQSYQGFLIENCTFTGNTATQDGGAIYIETDIFCHKEVTISGEKEEESIIRDCTFERNSGSDAHGIYIQSGSTTSIQILKCNFKDNGNNNHVIINSDNSIKNDIENCTFEYSDEQQSSAAISTNSTDVCLIGNLFSKCNSNTTYLRGTTDITNFELIENTFYFCHRGKIITSDTFIQAHTIKGNIFEDVQLTNIPSLNLMISSESILFDNNTFKSFNMNVDEGGVGIKLSRKNNNLLGISFESCYFIGNTNNNNHEAGGLRIDYYQNSGKASLSITKCLFERNTNNKGSGLMFCVNSKVTIEETIFKGNTGREGSSIYVKPDYDANAAKTEITIYKCTFERNPSSSSSSIFCNAGKTKSIIIESCTFNEEQGGIYVQNLEGNSLIIKKTNFIKTNTRSSIIISQNKALTQLTIDECTFDDCSGTSNKCLQISTLTPSFTFTNNVINNCKLSGNANYFGNINLNNQINTFELNNITFYNNTSNSASGGGSSLLISGTQKIIFNECHFINNHAFRDTTYNPSATAGPNLNGCGGGLQIGNCQILNTVINIRGCIFENNEAEIHGGGLSIAKYDSSDQVDGFLIENCEFKSNSALQKGGSIYIGSDNICGTSVTSTNDNAIIRSCVFERNTGSEAHGIYIKKVSSIGIQIQLCNFTDCGTNNYVIVDPNANIKNVVENCSFKYSNEQQSSSAISTKSTNIHFIGNTFHKCNSNTIHLQGSNVDTFELIDNMFYFCHRGTIIKCEESCILKSTKIKGNTFDDVILSEASIYLILSSTDASNSLSFENNTFKSFKMNTDIGGAGIKFKRELNMQLEVIFESCYFIGNTNLNNQHQGGGLRIDYYQNDGKASLRIADCTFDSNENHMGAAIAISVMNDINIEDCTFHNNIGQKGSAIYIKPDYGQSTSTITITRCNFNHNKGSTNSSIYFESGTTKNVKIESCKFEEEEGCIFVQNLGSKLLEISSSNFIKTTNWPSISIKQTIAVTQLTINYCTFDENSSPGNKCIYISTFAPTFLFTNNIIQNNQPTGCNDYISTINLNNKISTFELTNITFLNNTSNSLYGGGASMIILGTNQINFKNCHFTNNRAFQDSSVSRPTSSNEPYYNGDGGAIQIGYWCKTNGIDVSFANCDFKGNKAERHGGALSIQTLKTVNIEVCEFKNNIANCNIESASKVILENNFENHFHKKSNGRGGAIYINPSFSYPKDGLNCPATTDIAMKSFTVISSSFTSNNAYDGYAMYIEGDESETTFQFNTNTFTNNYNESNYVTSPNEIYGAVITSEIILQASTIIESNTWTYTNIQLKVKEVQFVDHYGNTPSTEFSSSNKFTLSDQFTNSDKFTHSNKFTNSDKFTHSDKFTYSNKFTLSDKFTMSDYFPSNNFTHSVDFTHSDRFTNSEKYTQSNEFSYSKGFSESNDFTNTNHFSYSESFTSSNDFTKSNMFSNSNEFNSSSEFSGSNQFTGSVAFSGSEGFTESKVFSLSNKFSESQIFSDSNAFSKSEMFPPSDQFSNSQIFSSSQMFSSSQIFSNTELFSQSSQFTHSDQFSGSNEFSKSEIFSSSNQFSNTQMFSSSQEFSNTELFSLSTQFTHSDLFSDSKLFSKSEIFSSSNQFSNTQMFSSSQEFSNTELFSLSTLFTHSYQFSDSNEFSKSVLFSLSNQFSNSQMFSSSQEFSNTELFSLSTLFTHSYQFSDSNEFSKSVLFSLSNQFSNSQMFSESNLFSLSAKFSLTSEFSKSEIYTKSNYFSISNEFTESFKFSQTHSFSETEQFTLSSVYSKSDKFSESHDFTLSNDFSTSFQFSHSNYFSSSNIFSKTEGFSSTGAFSITEIFSISTKFTESTIFSESTKFSLSNEFSLSNHFSLTNEFSFSTKFTNSAIFSLSTKFTESNDFTQSNDFNPTIFFSHSNEFSKTTGFTSSGAFSETTKFTYTNDFTTSNKFTQTDHFSLTSGFTNTKQFSMTNEFTNSNQFSNSQQFSESEGFTESYQFTPSVTLIPDDPSCVIESEDGNISYSERCDYSELEGKNATVLIVRANFTNFVEESDGGAIHIVNCSVRCNGTKFIDCASTGGGGGGIYINNTIEHEKNVDLINLTFIRCKAYYGGAVFVQSDYEQNRILIQSCLFKSNEAYPKRSGNGILFGGSSVYLIADDADIINDTFLESKGPGGCFRIFSPRDTINLLEESEKLSIKIDGCLFEQPNSIYYESKENGGSEVEINNCDFKGKLVKGKHYIDGKIHLNNSPKLRIRSCQFEHDINESVNVGLIKKISSVKIMKEIPINSQLNSQKVSNNNTIQLLGTLVILMTAIAILLMKLNSNHHNDNNYDDIKSIIDDNFESNNLL